MVSIDGTDISAATIDGTDVSEITIDGEVAWTAIPDSAISRWSLDDADTENGTALDSWGNNDGTINGATTGVSGANQTYSTAEAYSFDGTEDYVACGSPLTSGGEYSVAAWAKIDSNGDNQRYLFSTADPDTGWALWKGANARDNEWIFLHKDGNGDSIQVRSVAPNADQWYHLVGVYDGGQTILYVDGSQVASASATSHNPPTASAEIGRNPSGFGDPFNGDIDDVRAYSKGLTSTEVSDLYNTGSISG